ncbi:hypothetical protein QZH41_007372 [Actinostola sp. cb2023]|nr:hypothetical protein QZH41_007372 [Actinostola sp. cb2023]
MGSGNSKVVIRRASPVVHVNGYDNCIVSSSSEPKLVTEVNKPTVKAEERQSQQTDKNANHRQEVQSPPVEEIEVKPVSKTLKKTEEKLQLRGFTDPTLVAYCDETPALLEEFIELYEQVQIVKSNLGEEDFIALIKNPIYSISLLYSKERPDKIKKGNILSEIGFAEVYKEIMAKLIAKFPTLLSYDRELDQSVTLFATKALLTLAYLIDETNNELVMANKEQISYDCEKPRRTARHGHGTDSFEMLNHHGHGTARTYVPKNSLKKLSGPLLSRLHSLRIESPDYYHWSLKEDIGLYDVYNVLLFTDELEKLVG